MGARLWAVFLLDGKELCRYSVYGSFPGELVSTKELLAGENNCKPDDIEVRLETTK